jgi:hypothetical protein
MALSDAAIRAAKAQPKQFKLYDEGGLFLTVRPSGGKLWHLKYRHLGKEQLPSLGKRRDEASIDAVAKSLSRFETATAWRDFSQFSPKHAIAFKRKLDAQVSVRTGDCLSRATVHSPLSALRAFFFWLADQPGFKRALSYSDADYFNLAEKDVRVARRARTRLSHPGAAGARPSDHAGRDGTP